MEGGVSVWFNGIVLAVAMSVDALGIGVSYELQNVRIPWYAKGIVGLISSVVMYGSLYLGNALTKYFPPDIMNILGISILVLIGLGFIRNSIWGEDKTAFDSNNSSIIEKKEAIVLGLALSLDAVSAGIATGATGIGGALYFAILVGIMQYTFLSLGSLVAKRSLLLFQANRKICGVFSGLLLIIMAVVRGFG